MKTTLTIECASLAELYAVVDRLRGNDAKVEIQATTRPVTQESSQTTGEPQSEKKPRKPRSDAGQPRGPYKTTGEPAASAPGAPGSAAAPTQQPAAPATPTTSAAPEEPKSAAAGQSVPPAPAAAEPGKAPTIDDARAVLKRINDTPGLGMGACTGHLAQFHVNRISLVPAADYAEFIRLGDKMIADHLAQQKAAKK